jgi:hypothetical protein
MDEAASPGQPVTQPAIRVFEQACDCLFRSGGAVERKEGE